MTKGDGGEMKERLLEDLSVEMQCFISSLPSMMHQPSALKALYGMPRERYDLMEWGYCFSYLFREEPPLPDYEALEQYLAGKCVQKSPRGQE